MIPAVFWLRGKGSNLRPTGYELWIGNRFGSIACLCALSTQSRTRISHGLSYMEQMVHQGELPHSTWQRLHFRSSHSGVSVTIKLNTAFAARISVQRQLKKSALYIAVRNALVELCMKGAAALPQF